jgi:hypothetical protein
MAVIDRRVPSRGWEGWRRCATMAGLSHALAFVSGREPRASPNSRNSGAGLGDGGVVISGGQSEHCARPAANVAYHVIASGGDLRRSRFLRMLPTMRRDARARGEEVWMLSAISGIAQQFELLNFARGRLW